MMEIRKIIEIDAPIDVVFKALTDSKDLTQWFPDGGTFEAKVGGKMHFTFVSGHNQMDRDHHLDGEVLDIVPNKKLVYSFIPDEDYKPDGVRSQSTTVTWSLEEVTKNRTKVTLVHSGFTNEMERHFKETTAGWNYFVSRLVEYCRKKAS
jgi:uncharacterized protein YndB with AHSA1/START domain